MTDMRVRITKIPDVKIVEPHVFEDSRGFFLEYFNLKSFETHGITGPWVQDNHSRSTRGVLRGLHYQVRHPQGKLVRVVKGMIFDVAIDIRENSPTFGSWVGELLSSDNFRMLWIPKGFAHGFLTMSDTVDVLYKATDFYSPEHERTIRWDDPQLAIEWPLHGIEPIVSPKDLRGLSLAEAESVRL